jgi:hypothetical protein
MSNEVDDFLRQNASAGAPAFKFRSVGDSVRGTIVRRAIVGTTPIGGGEKVNNLVLEVETDTEHTIPDKDGNPVTGNQWSVWIKPSQLLSEIGRALRDAQAPPGSPDAGDRIEITFTGTEPASKPGFSPKKLYKVNYRVGARTSAAPMSVDDLGI